MLRAVQRTAVAAVLMVTVVGGQQVAMGAPRAPPERRCGALRGTAITQILATAVPCRTARTVARTHATSVKKGGSCKTRRIGCDIDGFRCLYAFRPISDTKVLCTRRGSEKLILEYRR